jgi:two-component system, cell cycle sensor histidine kinase and response regulator CckA
MGRETILVVEDEGAVRRCAVRALKEAGYMVLEAAHGGEALELDEQHSGPLHLLFTDIVLPQLGGRALAEVLRRRRPGLRVLFTSGYPAEAFTGQLPGDQGFILTKPYDPSCLARRVREVLDDCAG